MLFFMCPSPSTKSPTVLEGVACVRAALTDHPELFEVTLFETGTPVDGPTLEQIEKRLEITLPSALRELYAAVGFLRFEWVTRSEECLRLGYREELAYQEAALHITPPHELQALKHEPAVVPITSDQFGRSWCLDLRWGVDPTPIVWHERANWEGDDHEPDYDSFDLMWDDFAEFAFASKPTSQADLVWHLLNKGELMPPDAR